MSADGATIVTLRSSEALEKCAASPVYVAVMEWVPTLSNESTNVAVPSERFALPRTVAPSLNVTEPATVPAPGKTEDTVAVKLTASPSGDRFAEVLRVVVV